MKYLYFSIILLCIGKTSKAYTPFIKFSNCSDSLILNNGVYSFFDTSTGQDGIEIHKKYRFITPIMFIDGCRFVQLPYSTNEPQYIINEVGRSKKLDTGHYFIKGNEITLIGSFTFYGWGMKLKHYNATYKGYINHDKTEILLKLEPPYPKVNMRLNDQLQSEMYYKKYFFKRL